jgi:serine/threonine protein kinase
MQTGTTLNHYRIVERIGAGGMGEVYRARDERLDRDVAIKVLPEDVANDPERMRRFEREAKALAALNHPNIATVYGLETALSDADADADAGQPFLVMELLEGETLRQRIPRGGLGWQKTAEIGAAIAEGLAAAHGKGIVHRDLKPENVFLTQDGRIKILDFGLAKSVSSETGSAQPDESPTVSAATAAGVVLGTIGYMSPEQLRGEKVDHRTDIFALGCLVYETLSGRRAFSGPTSADVISAILTDDPPRLTDAAAGVPPELAAIVERCLAKRMSQRFQSARDLGFALSSTAATASSAATTVSAGSSDRFFVGCQW